MVRSNRRGARGLRVMNRMNPGRVRGPHREVSPGGPPGFLSDGCGSVIMRLGSVAARRGTRDQTRCGDVGPPLSQVFRQLEREPL